MKLTVKGSSAVDPQSGGTLSPYTSHSLYLCRAGRQPPCARGERCGVQCSSGAGGHQERDQLLLQTAAAGGGLGQELPPLPLLGQGGHLHWWEQTGGKPLPPPSLTRSLLNALHRAMGHPGQLQRKVSPLSFWRRQAISGRTGETPSSRNLTSSTLSRLTMGLTRGRSQLPL